MVSMRIFVPPDLKDKVFARAAEEGISAGEYFRLAVEERLSNQETDPSDYEHVEPGSGAGIAHAGDAARGAD
jgi:hypothetical protein